MGYRADADAGRWRAPLSTTTLSRSSSATQASAARWATSLLFIADGAGFGVWAAHIPVFKELLHLSSTALSVILLALVLGSLVSMPLVGQLVARLGSRTVVYAAIAGYILATAALSRVAGFWLLVALAALFGAAKGALDVSINAQGAYVERKLGKLVISSFQGCWSLGGLLGATVSSYILRRGGSIRTDFLEISFALLICAVVACPFLLREETKAGSSPAWRLPDRRLLRIAGIAFLGLFAEGAMADWDGVYLNTSVGVTLAQAALGYAVFSLAMAAGRFVGDRLLERFTPVAVLRVSGCVLCGGVAFALVLNSWWAALLGFLCAGLGLANIVPVVWGAAGRDQTIGAGPALATVTTVGYFGFLAGPPVIGALAAVSSVRIALIAVSLFGVAIAGFSRSATQTTT